MLSKINSSTLNGIDAIPIIVEINVSNGIFIDAAAITLTDTFELQRRPLQQVLNTQYRFPTILR